jgi:hypothetical protein
MACHGDKGQGLTPDWVAQWDLEPNACWESKCHASNHPPEGFVLPRSIPGVVSPVIQARFATALELHDFLQSTMPWHAPGSREPEEYWQLTAYLLELNGVDPGPVPLDAESSAAVVWGAQPATPTPPAVETHPAQKFLTPVILLAVGVAFIIIVYLFLKLKNSRK